jgi:hypothetical protein
LANPWRDGDARRNLVHPTTSCTCAPRVRGQGICTWVDPQTVCPQAPRRSHRSMCQDRAPALAARLRVEPVSCRSTSLCSSLTRLETPSSLDFSARSSPVFSQRSPPVSLANSACSSHTVSLQCPPLAFRIVHRFLATRLVGNVTNAPVARRPQTRTSAEDHVFASIEDRATAGR